MQEDLRYPIGEYIQQPYSENLKNEWIADISFCPNGVEAAIQNLDEKQLQTPYREGGWTVHQLIHHLADSHMNAYFRFKAGYTEDNPTIKPYDENDWVRTADVQHVPVNISITLLFALHSRWIELLSSFIEDDWNKTIYHPEHKKTFTLWHLLGMYAWHGRHHTAHITSLRTRMGWE
jgi:uncharacterized damage-inducible protein DinB